MQSQGLTAYYTAEGNPPGRWTGTGIDSLNRTYGDIVSSSDAIAVWQDFTHPDTGAPLGRKKRTSADRSSDSNQLADTGAQTQRDNAGFDLTFTIPKDASVLWALADPATQQAIADAHTAAIQQTLGYLERHVLQTRAGHGGVAKLKTRGLIAGQWDHWDTRDGDPHLHSHVVISNRVQRASDGKWVTIDSRPLHSNTVHLSEVHQNLFMDELSRRLGVEWNVRTGNGTNAAVPEIDGFSSEVRTLFSSRNANVQDALAAKIAAFVERYDRQPTEAERRDLDSAAWRETRRAKPKQVASLHDRCALWRTQAESAGHSPDTLVAHTLGRDTTPTLRATTHTSVHTVLATLTQQTLHARQVRSDETDTARIAALAARVEDEILERRATWSRANVHAEVERLMRGIRASSPEVRETATTLIVEAVLARCVEIHPARYRVDGDDPRLTLRTTTVFDDPNRAAYTSQRSLDREATLVAAATTTGVITPPSDTELDELLTSVNQQQHVTRGFALAPDQDEAVRGILRDTTRLSVLIGPAGTGKTTTMSGLRTAWETLYGTDHVIGLTTSAQAAHVLSEDLDAEATTISKWLYESTAGNARRTETLDTLTAELEHLHTTNPESNKARELRARIAELAAERDAWTLHPNTLVIVDEASMTSTAHLTTLLHHAESAGAKLLVVGDHRQIDAVEAGGALSLLAHSAPSHELTSVWRFHNEWEKAASLKLRNVHDTTTASDLIALYDEHGRLHYGDDTDMLDASFNAAFSAMAAGRSAIAIASTNSVVHDLNERFSNARYAQGLIDKTHTTALRDGHDAGVGEIILARHNNRRLLDANGDFIRNGTLMTITEIHPDGSATATRNDTGAHVTLPADYLSQHTELGYATTAHRCQGMTVDEAHLYIPAGDPVPSELLYVAMTRGQDANHAYIATADTPEDDATVHGRLIASEDTPTWQERLTAMMTTRGAERSATDQLEGAEDDLNNLARLSAEFEYLLSLESTVHITDALLAHHGIDPLHAEDNPLFDSLAAAHRAAHATNPEHAIAALTEPVHGDAAADSDATLRVLIARNRAIAQNNPRRFTPIPVPITDRADNVVRSLSAQVKERIEARQHELTRRAAHSKWAEAVPPRLVPEVAQFRDLYSINSISPLGLQPSTRDTRHREHWDHLKTQLNAAPVEKVSHVLQMPPVQPQRRGPSYAQ